MANLRTPGGGWLSGAGAQVIGSLCLRHCVHGASIGASVACTWVAERGRGAGGEPLSAHELLPEPASRRRTAQAGAAPLRLERALPDG
jgi:hypothetical protein